MKKNSISLLRFEQHARAMTLGSLLLGVALLPISVCAQERMKSPEPPPRLIAPVMPQRGMPMLPLQRLVRIALDRSPATREAQANWRASQQDTEQAKADLWPHVEMNANTAAAKLDNGTATAITGGAGAIASYTLYDFGRIRNNIDAKQSQASAMQAAIVLAREAATYDTVNAYLQLVKYERLIHIYEKHIVDLNDLVGKLSDIVAVFEGRASELTQAKTRLGQSREALNGLKAKKREFQLALMRQIGSNEMISITGDDLPEFPIDTPAKLLDLANQQHPKMVAAKAEAASAEALIAQAQAAREPQVDVQLAKQAGRNALNQSYPLQLYLSAKWAVFQGFGDKAGEQALIERSAAAKERVAQLQIELDFNVKSAWADYEAQATRVNDMRDLVRGTDQVRQDYFIQWRDLGKRTLLDVLTAEGEFLNTQLSLASSEVDQVLALARMRYEAGTLKEWLVGDEGQAIADGYQGDKLTALLPEVAQPVVIQEKPTPKAIEMAASMAQSQTMVDERSTAIFAVAPSIEPVAEPVQKQSELPAQMVAEAVPVITPPVEPTERNIPQPSALMAPALVVAIASDELPLPAHRGEEASSLVAQGWGP